MPTPEPAPPQMPEVWRKRRARLARKIHSGTAIIFAAKKSASHAMPFRQNPNLWYLCGCSETDSALVIIVDSGKVVNETIYCRKRNKVIEQWDGKILGPAKAKSLLGVGNAKPWTSEKQLLSDVLPDHGQIFLDYSCGENVVSECISHMERFGSRCHISLHDLRAELGQMRMIKDRSEIEAIKVAARHTIRAYLAACDALANVRWEQEIAAEIGNIYCQAGGRHAFQPIVAGGPNACTAHYVNNNCKLRSGQLILLDTGCEINGYTADMTRVVPVSGRFSEAQRDLHDIVVAAQEKAMRKIKPGSTLVDANKAASLELAHGLIHLGICRGTPAKVATSDTLAQYYFHSIGHMLGMDVHDPYIKADPDTHPKLRPNMVATIEPGLYLDDSKKVPRELRNTGIRIEDTVAVTSKGCENLTAQAPKTSRSVEKLLEK